MAKQTSNAIVSFCEYGKAKVRITKVVRDQPQAGVHSLQEVEARVLLQGDFRASFEQADNSLVVPTDTCKNTLYYLSRDHLNGDIEAYAIVVVQHFLKSYSHVSYVKVSVKETLWNRLEIDGNPHPHSFEQIPLKRKAYVEGSRAGIQIESRLDNLRVLKTTGSGFSNFHMCKLTTLVDVSDRILSTNVKAKWTIDAQEALAGRVAYTEIFQTIRKQILSTFATTYSPSVQATMWEIGQWVLDNLPQVTSLYLDLPNLHNWHYDKLERFGYDNNATTQIQVFTPTDEPHGCIRCTVTRKQPSKL